MAPTLDSLISMSIDFDFAAAFLRGVKIQLGALPVSLASPVNLLPLERLAGRKQDLADIEASPRLHEQGCVFGRPWPR